MIWDLFDMRVMQRINNQVGVPFMAGVHGKNDATLGWVEYYYWYDSLNVARQGGLWFWDQRNHDGQGKNFNDNEAYLNYDRFFSNRSYPAFSFCSINQNWGNGSAASGAPYGAFNGYLDWEDESIVDNESSYSIRCYIKDMYASGILMTPYNTCTSDLTLRRVQHFNPQIGQSIEWSVRDASQQILNSGSFIYTGQPITLNGITIKREGSIVLLEIQDQRKTTPETTVVSSLTAITLEAIDHGYIAHIVAASSVDATFSIFDALGRLQSLTTEHLISGENVVPLHASSGLKFFHASIGSLEFSKKLIFN
jgi:hypothetical protein